MNDNIDPNDINKLINCQIVLKEVSSHKGCDFTSCENEHSVK